jgi:hypothetical protein
VPWWGVETLACMAALAWHDGRRVARLQSGCVTALCAPPLLSLVAAMAELCVVATARTGSLVTAGGRGDMAMRARCGGARTRWSHSAPLRLVALKHVIVWVGGVGVYFASDGRELWSPRYRQRWRRSCTTSSATTSALSLAATTAMQYATL